MKDPGQALKDAYSTALQALSVNSLKVPFYKTLKEAQGQYYMYVSDYTAVDDSNKDDFQTECTITVNCTYVGNRGYQDETFVDDMANQVLQTINVKATSYISLTGFSLITTSLDNSIELTGNSKDEAALIRALRFRHIIGES